MDGLSPPQLSPRGEAADGRWAAFEVKLGVGQIDAAAAGLLKFAG